MRRRSALITGISGQDGGYLAERLLADGWVVHGTVHPTGGADQPEQTYVPEEVHLHPVDFTATDQLGVLIRKIRPTHVYNLAAISSVGRSWEIPEVVATVNGLAVVAMLAALRDLHDSGESIHFIQASSAEIFGDASETPQTERTPIAPNNPYGASKACAHTFVRAYRNCGLHASNLILFNHESPRRPETFVSRKVTAGVARISRGLQERLVLGNLDARRDFGWAPDYVDAMLRAAKNPEPGDYVISSGETHSIAELLAVAFSVVGIDRWDHFVEVDPMFMRAADVREQVGDPSRAQAILGWHPTVNFPEMVRRMVEADLDALAAAERKPPGLLRPLAD